MTTARGLDRPQQRCARLLGTPSPSLALSLLPSRGSALPGDYALAGNAKHQLGPLTRAELGLGAPGLGAPRRLRARRERQAPAWPSHSCRARARRSRARRAQASTRALGTPSPSLALSLLPSWGSALPGSAFPGSAFPAEQLRHLLLLRRGATDMRSQAFGACRRIVGSQAELLGRPRGNP